MKISIIILTYKRLDKLKKCIASIERYPLDNIHLYVVDNNTDDYTQNFILNDKKYINYIKGDNNLGVCSRNLAIKKITDGIIFQCDDDATVDPNYWITIRDYFKDESIGAIGQDAWLREGWLHYKHFGKIGGECDFVTGYGWAFRKKDNWLYDVNYAPFWREESDLQLQIKYDGYKIIKCKNLVCHASSRIWGDMDLLNRNTEYLINKWRNKI